jgi:hypothetical protein
MTMIKPISEWTHHDLQNLIRDQVQESLNLDYKASASLDKANQKKINEFSKDVAAFANSAGGRIIYGIVEEGHLPTAIDDGVTDPTITREWIEQKLQSTIRPRVQGLIIRQIDLPKGGRSFVIEIPAATTFAPHMSEDQKYYRRYNFESVAMQDYEVKDAMRRSSAPDLFVDVRWLNVEATIDGSATTCMIFIGNRSSEPALYSSVSVWIDKSVTIQQHDDWRLEDSASYRLAGQTYPIQLLHRNLIVPHHQPVFKEKEWNIGSFKFVFHRTAICKLGWRVEAPGNVNEKWGTFHLDSGRVLWSQDD